MPLRALSRRSSDFGPEVDPGHNPRSTVGTVTEIQDYLRLLFGRAGEPHCPPRCERSIRPESTMRWSTGSWPCPTAPGYQLLGSGGAGQEGHHAKLISGLGGKGFARGADQCEVL